MGILTMIVAMRAVMAVIDPIDPPDFNSNHPTCGTGGDSCDWSGPEPACCTSMGFFCYDGPLWNNYCYQCSNEGDHCWSSNYGDDGCCSGLICYNAGLFSHDYCYV
eukprot:878806_1